jgi:hypothetical protein
MTDTARPEATAFLTQMLWRPRPTAEPIVALLGPRGAGKSTALAAISQECGATVIHASIDFGAHDFDPVQAAAYISFELMRGWDTARRDPTFHRLALGLLARNEQLEEQRPQAQRQIHGLIRQYVRNTKAGHAASRATAVVQASLDVAVKSLGHLAGRPGAPGTLARLRPEAETVISSLFQGAARLSIRSALDYYRNIPEAESAHAYDSLIALNRAGQDRAIQVLLQAFLADMADHAGRYTLPSACQCMTPDGLSPGRHTHAWVLLADGAQSNAGSAFLTALARARSSRVRSGLFDPLLAVGAYAKWDSRNHWHVRWREPWSAGPGDGQVQHGIPRFSQATYGHWARISSAALANGDVTSVWFPVWLDALPDDRAAALISRGAASAGARPVAARLTGGHPGALLALQDQFPAASADTAGQVSAPGSWLITETPARAPLWRRWAEENLPAELLIPAAPWTAVPRTCAAAAYLADSRAATSEHIPGSIRGLQYMLEQLRDHLWLTTFTAAPSRLGPVTATGAGPPPAPHPWLARCLLAAAASPPWIRDKDGKPIPPVPGQPADPTWDDLFGQLYDPATGPADPDRILYYQLARQDNWTDPPDGLTGPDTTSGPGFPAIVAALAGSFQEQDHRVWVRRLDYLTSAPCRLPLHRTTADAYALIMNGQDGSGEIEVAIAKLVALLWLYRDPLTEQTERWDHEIRDSFERLRSLSWRADTSALREAADCF